MDDSASSTVESTIAGEGTSAVGPGCHQQHLCLNPGWPPDSHCMPIWTCCLIVAGPAGEMSLWSCEATHMHLQATRICLTHCTSGHAVASPAGLQSLHQSTVLLVGGESTAEQHGSLGFAQLGRFVEGHR